VSLEIQDPHQAMFIKLCLAAVVVASLSSVLQAQSVSYALSQSTCTEVDNEPPLNDCRWNAGLYSHIDQVVKQGRIIAYKLQWSTGWSGWYVPGENDIDIKYNPTGNSACSVPLVANSMRRWWSYFYDHTHSYIICKNP